MHPAGFDPTISAGERPQTYALDYAATGTGWDKPIQTQIQLAKYLTSTTKLHPNLFNSPGNETYELIKTVYSQPISCIAQRKRTEQN
jgi:hypothetical protein